MDWFPAFLKLIDRPVLVIGAGEIAARKIDLLLRAQADVRIVAPKLGAVVQAWVDEDRVRWLAEGFEPNQLIGCVLVIGATDDDSVNRQVAAAAQAANVPVNVVDDPAHCTAIIPSVLDRSPLVVAVSSGGAAPVLARQLRARLETLIPASYGRLAELARRYRQPVKEKLPFAKRRKFWESVFNGPIAEQMLAGRATAAENALQQALAQVDATPPQGEVYLVGGGPGDPDLLTFRALRLMQQADVVLYDRLVSPAVLDLVRRDAERINVGKQRDRHPIPQEGINQLLVEHAQQGKRVLRLKGGDPFIFGRGGEEIATLAAAGIPFQIVPGITAAAGCSAYAGIPLTHRDHAQSCQFVTGHMKDGVLDLDWNNLVQAQKTVVFYMGLHSLPELCAQLIAHGAPVDRPAALVEAGTTPAQRVIVGDLSNLPTLAKTQAVKPPSLVIVGDVVTLRDQLAWFGEAVE